MSRYALSGCLILSLLFAVPALAAEQDRDAMLLAYFEVWNSGDLDRLNAIVAPDFKRNGRPEESCRSRAELKQLIAQARTIFTVDDYMTEEHGGAMRGSFYGVHAEVDRIVDRRHPAQRLLSLELDAARRFLLDLRLFDGHALSAVSGLGFSHARALRSRLLADPAGDPLRSGKLITAFLVLGPLLLVTELRQVPLDLRCQVALLATR